VKKVTICCIPDDSGSQGKNSGESCRRTRNVKDAFLKYGDVKEDLISIAEPGPLELEDFPKTSGGTSKAHIEVSFN
jgi:hypothetical protein